MDDQDASRSRSMLTTLKGATHKSRQKLTDLLRSPLQDLRRRLDKSLGALLTDPDAISAVQHNLARLANISIRLGFLVDPNTELLFRFVDWIDEHHGRPTVMQALLQSPLLQDPTFLDALAHISQTLLPWQDDEEPLLRQPQIDAFKEQASLKLLLLLAQLAALEYKKPVPTHDTDALVDYFQSSPIPEEFKPLAEMARGRELKRPEEPSLLRWTKGLSGRLGITTSADEEQTRGLRRFIPGLGDETLEFLVLSTTFVIQTYLLRHLLESLPELAQELASWTRQSTNPLDMNDE